MIDAGVGVLGVDSGGSDKKNLRFNVFGKWFIIFLFTSFSVITRDFTFLHGFIIASKKGGNLRWFQNPFPGK